MNAKVNGYDAVPDRPIGDMQVWEERWKILVGEGTARMDEKKASGAEYTASDGHGFKFKREGDLKMYVNGEEIDKDRFDDGLAEVSGINSGKKFVETAKSAGEVKDQVRIQATRSAVITTFSASFRTASAVSRTSDKTNMDVGSWEDIRGSVSANIPYIWNGKIIHILKVYMLGK